MEQNVRVWTLKSNTEVN